MSKKNIFFGLVFIIFVVSSLAIVTAENDTITNVTGVNHGSYTEYTINYPNGTIENRNITHNDTNNLVNNHTVEITGEILDFELEPNSEPKPPVKKVNEVTMKETGNNTLLLCITLIICSIILLIVVMKLKD